MNAKTLSECRPAAFRAAAVLTAVLFFLPGCGEKGQRRSEALDAAIVSGADVAGQVDYDSLWKAPVLDTLRAFRADRDPERARVEEERARNIEEASGLSREDITALLFTADLDSVDFTALDREGEFRKLRAAMAATFVRKITLEQVEAALQVLSADDPGIVVEKGELGKSTVLTVSESQGGAPFFFVARSTVGKTVYVTPNSGSMADLLTRESEGRAETLPAAISDSGAHLPEGSQFNASLVIPDGLQLKINEKINELQSQSSRNPGMSLVLSFVAPFRKIAGLSVGSRFDEGLEVGVAADLGGAEEAVQAGTILQTLLLPLVKSKIAQNTAVDPQSLEEKISTGSNGSTLTLKLKLEESDLQSLTR